MFLKSFSKFKIFDNLRRSLFEISIIIAGIYFLIISNIFKINVVFPVTLLGIITILPFVLEYLNVIIFKKDGEQKQNTFTPKIAGVTGAIYRAFITFGSLPYKAYVSAKAIVITLYRILVSKKHKLEWMTSEEAEKQAKSDVISYKKQMIINLIIGLIQIIYTINIGKMYGIIA